MTIKSDKWIKRQCTPPKLAYLNPATNTALFYYPEQFSNGEDRHIWEKLQERKGLRLISLDEYPDLLAQWKPMIEPFNAELVREEEHRFTADEGYKRRVISYGVSSYGYDTRVASEFKIFTNVNSAIVDPKNFDEKCYVDVDGTEDGYVIIPPNGFALARTVEYFRIPRDVLTICLGKSTYARCGIIVNVTPLEPEWEGHVVLEFSNTTNLPAKIYVNEGVAQFLFLQSDEACEISYKDRGGKYMGQTGVTLPRL